MPPDSSKGSPPKKPITKNWQPQGSRTAKSIKKLLGSIDALKPFVQAHPGEKIHRAAVAERIHHLLTAGTTTRHADANLHVLIFMFFDLTFKYEVGQEVDLEWAWRTFLENLDAHSRWAKVFNTDARRQAFFWQIAGHTASTVKPLPPRVQLKGVLGYWVNDKFVTHPKGHMAVPTFLTPGAIWDGKEVFAHTVKNMCCTPQAFGEFVRLAVKEN